MTRWLAAPKFDGFWRPSSNRASGSTSGSTAGCWRSSRRKRWARTARSLASTKLSSLSEQVEPRCSLPFLHRLRGKILLKRDPADPAPAEEAFRTAIAIAKGQGARSPRLQAALALAKLYQSTDRAADAHAVLALALEGFAPTPEMPEIAEAQALLAALAETDELKREANESQRRLHLANILWPSDDVAKGFAAEETKTAFARADGARGDDRQLFRALRGGPLPMDHGASCEASCGRRGSWN